MTRIVVSNVQVLTAGTRYDQEKAKDGEPIPSSVVTLLVTPEDAERIALASDRRPGDAALRNPLDAARPTPPGSEPAALFGEAPPPAPVVNSRPGGSRAWSPSAPPPPPPPPPKVYTVEAIRAAKRTEEVVRQVIETCIIAIASTAIARAPAVVCCAGRQPLAGRRRTAQPAVAARRSGDRASSADRGPLDRADDRLRHHRASRSRIPPSPMRPSSRRAKCSIDGKAPGTISLIIWGADVSAFSTTSSSSQASAPCSSSCSTLFPGEDITVSDQRRGDHPVGPACRATP